MELEFFRFTILLSLIIANYITLQQFKKKIMKDLNFWKDAHLKLQSQYIRYRELQTNNIVKEK